MTTRLSVTTPPIITIDVLFFTLSLPLRNRLIWSRRVIFLTLRVCTSTVKFERSLGIDFSPLSFSLNKIVSQKKLGCIGHVVVK